VALASGAHGLTQLGSVSQCQEFSEVFSLCVEVLEKADKPSLIKATLEAMLRFLNWIPLGYIFETPVIDHLISRFLEVPEFRNVTLKCLSEIGGLQIGPEYNAKFVILFNLVMSSINKMVPPRPTSRPSMPTRRTTTRS
jgi:exportin-1